MNLDEYISAVEQRVEKATPGPWVVYRPWLSHGHLTVHGVIPRANLHPEEGYQVRTEHNHNTSSYSLEVAVPAHGHPADDKSEAANNMELIAHCPTDIKTLLSMLNTAMQALGGIASRHRPEHEMEAYWNSMPLSMCAEVLANDTKYARKALADMEKMVSGE